ncbi:MAG: restriction endonuclease subunit S [Proteobacteria bacterium]|nr:restriction endonuclease subunit S [Pseudomonadota bacterium]
MTQKQTLHHTPPLRFPEFRGAWAVKSLGELYVFKPTNSFSRDKLNYENGLVKNIHYGDIHTKFSTLFDIKNEVVPFINASENLDKIKPENYCLEGDIIFADASEDLADVGKNIEIIHLHNQKLLSGLHTILARQKSKELIVGFGGYLFKSNLIRTEIKRQAHGSKVLGISANRISNIEIYYPSSLKEQDKITECLSSLDEVITAQGDRLDGLKDYKRGLMQQLFPADGQTTPTLRFREFQGKAPWEVKLLGEQGDFLPSLTGKKGEDFGAGNARFIPYLNVFQNTFINEETLNLVNVADGEKQNCVQKGDVFFTVSSETPEDAGMSSVLLESIENCYLNSFCAMFRFSVGKELNSVFIGYLLRQPVTRSYLSTRAQGATRFNLSRDAFKNLPIYIPPLAEQKKIAECLFSLDQAITAQEQIIKKLKHHKNGLMQQLFPEL